MKLPQSPQIPYFTALFWLCLLTPLLATPDIQVKGGSTLSPFSLSFGSPLTESNINFNNIANGEPTPAARRGTIFGERDNVRDPLVRLGETTFHYFRIYNRGDQTLNITSITFDDPQFSADDLDGTNPMPVDGSSIAAGERLTFGIHFTPTVAGPTSALCTITTNDPDTASFTFSIFGDAIGEIVVSGAPLNTVTKQTITSGDATPTNSDGTDFGTSLVNPASPNLNYFEIFNPDNEPIDIDLVTLLDSLGSTGRAQFTMPPSQTGPSTIPAGGSRTFQIAYDPQTSGIHETYLGINVADAPTSYIFKIRGMTPQEPDATVYAGTGGVFRPGTLIPDNNATTSTATLTDFGELSVGAIASGPFASTGEREHRFRMENSGLGTLQIGAGFSSSNGNFSVRFPQTTVPPSDSMFFFIKFQPTSGGTKSSTISIPTNNPDNPFYIINVTGVGIVPGLSVTGSQNSNGTFNSVASNQSATTSNGTRFPLKLLSDPLDINYFRFTNTGDAPLDITGITLQGAHPGDFFMPFGGPSHFLGTIDPGSTRVLLFGFNPSISGTRTTQVAIATNTPGTPTFFLQLRGETTLGPIAAITGRRNSSGSYQTIGNPGIVTEANNGTTFDPIAIGNAVINTFQITNDGDALLKNLTYTSSLSDYSFTATPDDIAPGATANFGIKFSNSGAGTRRATITITAGPAGNTPYTFTVLRETPAPRITVKAELAAAGTTDLEPGDNTPSELDNTDFGQYFIGESDARNFAIHNVGTQTLNVTNVIFSGDDDDQFTFSGISPSGVNLDPGKSASFKINFEPTSAGVKFTTVNLTNNDPDNGLFKFVVQGTAVARPQIRVRGRTGTSGAYADIDADSVTPISSNGTLFPPTAPGQPTISQVTVINEGSNPLTIGKVVSDNPEFEIFDINLNTVVPPNDTAEFIVRLNPTSIGPKSSRVTIFSDDPGAPAFSFLVEGPGSKPVMEVYYTGGATDFYIADDFHYTDHPSGTHFGPVEPGVTQSHTFEFRNTGTEPLEVINESGSGGRFMLSGALASSSTVTIAPGAASPLTVTYSSTTVGNHTDAPLFSTNDTDVDGHEFNLNLTGTTTGPAELELLGEGLIPTTAFRPITILSRNGDATNGTFFPATQVGQTATRRIKLSNTGVAPLGITSITSLSSQFTVDANTATIAPGGELITNLNFTPSGVGFYVDHITVNTDIDGSTAFSFSVGGSGEGRVHLVRGGPDLQVLIADGDTIASPSDGTAFPSLTPNSESIHHYYEIVNIVDQPITISGVSFSGGNSSEFEIASRYPHGVVGNASGAIPAGGTGTIAIRYAPTALGSRSTTVQIHSNATIDPLYEFTITGAIGSVVRLGPPPRIETASGQSVAQNSTPRVSVGTDYGTLSPTSSSSAAFRIRNFYSTPVVVTDLTSSNPQFSIFGFPSLVTPFSTSKLFFVRFDGSPTTGIYESTITALTTDPFEPVLSFTVRATVGAEAVVDPEVTNHTTDGDDFLIDYTAPPGITFRLATSTDLETWFGVPGQTGLTGGTIRISDVFGQPANDPRRFYRIDQE